MPTPINQLLSRTIYETDGVNVDWEFSFAGGYLDPSHVKAFTETEAGARTPVTVTEAMLTGPFTLRITPALDDDLTLTIYRDTPKDLPLVDFTDESGFSEVALDTNAKQAVFIAAEAVDVINTSTAYDAEQAAQEAATSAAAAAASAASIGSALVEAEGFAAAAAASAASINPDNYATAAQGLLADSALQPGEAATPAQGAKADSALQAAAIGVAIQAYDAATAKLNQAGAWTARQVGTPLALTIGSNIATDLSARNNFTATLTGTHVLDNPTGATAGSSGVIAISQDGVGGRTITFAANWDFPTGADTTISSGANEVTLLCYYVVSASKIRCSLSKD